MENRFVEVAFVEKELVDVAEVVVERVTDRFVAVSLERVLSQEKPEDPPERRAVVAPVVVQNGTRPDVSADEVPTVPEPALEHPTHEPTYIVLHLSVLEPRS